MNNKQTEKVNMIDAAMVVLNTPANKALWTGNATFAAAVGNVSSNIGIISGLDTQRMAGPQPFTETKGQAKTTLIEATLLHAAAGRGYAASIGNTNMKAVCTIAETDLTHSKDADLGSRYIAVYNAVLSNIGSMGAWAVNATTLAALNGDINTFNSLVGAPMAQMSMQHAAGGNIDTVLTTIEGVLEDMLDTLMVQFKSGHATFYEAYTSARKIHSTGVHHSTTFKGFVYKSAGVALPYAKVVLSLDGNEVRKHFTADDGHYRFTKLHLGNFTITVSCPGYVTQSKVIDITTLQNVETDFTLVTTGTTPTGGGTIPIGTTPVSTS